MKDCIYIYHLTLYQVLYIYNIYKSFTILSLAFYLFIDL